MKLFFSLWDLLNNQYKLRFLIILFLIILQVFLEILGIAAVIPFVTLILNPSGLADLPFLSTLANNFDFSNTNKNLPIFCFIFFSIFLIKNIFLIFTYKIIFDYSFDFRKFLSSKLMNKYLHQNYSFFFKNPYSTVASNLNEEINNASRNYLRPLVPQFMKVLFATSTRRRRDVVATTSL